ncbi:MAG: hypothetical protein ACI8UO_005867 [Verrucomicrobiales bacterium]|jgi:hypothetical protein
MKKSLFSNRSQIRLLALPILLQLLLLIPATAEKITLLGFWNFDESRRAEYIASVKARQENQNMGEIAAQMGMAQIENSSYEFGVDAINKQPYMKIIDKATKKIDTIYLKVEVMPSKDLKMTDSETGNIYIVKPTGNDKMLFVDNFQKLSIPLRRIND